MGDTVIGPGGFDEVCGRKREKSVLSLKIPINEELIHRDLRPENILLNRDAEATINHFDLSKILTADSKLITQSCFRKSELVQAPSMAS